MCLEQLNIAASPRVSALFCKPLDWNDQQGILVSQTFGVLREDVSVLLVDLSLPGAQQVLIKFPEEGLDADLINTLSPLDVAARPSFPELELLIDTWLLGETAGIQQFYSAHEAELDEEEVEAVPSTPGPTSPAKAKAKPKAKVTGPNGSTPTAKAAAVAKTPRKKATVATLALQVEAIAASLPGITQQLMTITKRQEAMEAAKPVSSPVALLNVPPNKAAAPVSALISGQPHLPVPKLTQLVGPPPRVRTSPTLPVLGGHQHMEETP